MIQDGKIAVFLDKGFILSFSLIFVWFIIISISAEYESHLNSTSNVGTRIFNINININININESEVWGYLLIKILMLFIPFDYFIFDSIYSPEEIKEILNKHIYKSEYFEGISTERSFQVRKRLKNLLWKGYDDFKPIITGKISEDANGSKIKLHSRLGYNVIIIFTLMISAIIIMSIKNQRVDIGSLIFVGFAYLVTTILYKPDYFSDKKYLQDLLGKK